MKKRFEKIVEEKAPEFGSVPFWSLNDELTPEEMRRQVRFMYEKKMKGFFLHARMGLTTEYLSEKWFSCIEAAADEADKYGMEAWLYDENGFPSGYAGMKLLEDRNNFAKYLTADFKDEPDRDALRCYTQEDGRYLCVYRHEANDYVDTMDAGITRKFVQITHEAYKARFGDRLGKRIPGFFTDEPEYYRWHTPWSDTIPYEFRKAYDYDVFSGLDALFIDRPGAEQFRYDYWKLCNRLYTENFQKYIYDWAERNGCQITGHTIEESFLAGQMWCTGGVMPFYEYEHIPGIDKLCRGIPNDLAVKQVASVAAQLGKKRVLSEMYAACGWDVPLKELKRIAEWQYCAGINLMCQHLLPYSLRGQRKTDYPCFYSEHNPWMEYAAEFDEYFNRLGAALAEGNEHANVLVIHPMHSCWMKYLREVDGDSIAELQASLDSLLDELQAHQITWHFGDETILAGHADVFGNKITVGECSYDTVVIPLCYTLDSYTAKLLKRFISAGGKVCAFASLPEHIDGRRADMKWLRPNMTMEELFNEAPVRIRKENGEPARNIRFRMNDREDGKTYYILNVGEDEVKVDIDLHTSERIKIYDPSNGTASFVPNAAAGGKLKHTFAPGDSIVLFTEKEERPVNTLVLDKAVVYYGEETNGKKEPIEKIRDLTLQKRYAGEMTLKFDFNAGEIPSGISLCVEPMNYKAIRVNGEEVHLGNGFYLDRSFRTADISKKVKKGRNEIELCFEYRQDPKVYEILYNPEMAACRTCLTFDTEIENIYLFGDFAVSTEAGKWSDGKNGCLLYDGDFVITDAPKEYDGELCKALVQNGYPFYGGEIHCHQTFTLFRNESVVKYARLELAGHYSAAEVYINDRYVTKLLFGNTCDVSGFVKPGDNTMDIYFVNSARNVYGPFHHVEGECLLVAPNTFTSENGWTEEGTAAYVDRYAFMPFGIEPVIHIGD